MTFETVRQQQSTVDRIVALGSPESDCAFYRFLFSATLCTIWHWSEWQNNVPKESFQQISLGFSTEKASYIAVTSRPFSPVLMLLYKLVLCQFRPALFSWPFFCLHYFSLLSTLLQTQKQVSQHQLTQFPFPLQHPTTRGFCLLVFLSFLGLLVDMRIFDI